MAREKRSSQYLETRKRLLSLLPASRKSGEPLPSERELAETLGVSRDTVRAAIANLLLSEHLERRQGRKGVFASLKLNSFNVGVLLARGEHSIYAGESLSFFTGAVERLGEAGFSACVLNAQAPETNLNWLIERNSLDALLWFGPSAPVLQELDSLLASGFPVAAILSRTMNESDNPLRSNFICWGKAETGRERARFFLARGRSRLAYSGVQGETFEAFRDELRRSGVDFDMNLLLKGAEDVARRLPKLLAAGEIDGVVSDGGLSLIDAVLAAFSSAPKHGSNAALLLDYALGVELLLKARPEVEVSAFSFPPPPKEIGRVLASMLVRSAQEHLLQEPASLTHRLAKTDGSPLEQEAG